MWTPRDEHEVEPTVIQTLSDDVRRIAADVRDKAVGRRVRRTFSDLEEFYLSSPRRERLAGMGRVKRWIYLSLWLLKGLFLKLTPARRMLLILGFLFLWTSISIGVEGSGVRVSNVPFVGVALILVVLMLELKDKLLARDELEAGRAVQQALLPTEPPRLEGWDIRLSTRSANEVGGDLVDCVPLEGGRMGVVLGDVAGKGLPAALLMAKLQATLRALAPESGALGDLASRVNRILHRDTPSNSFATLVFAEMGPGSSRIRLLNAGHMPPIVVRRSGLEELDRGGAALGVQPGGRYREQHVDLDAGDTLVVYSDGVTEAMNAQLEFFGDERLKALLAHLGGLTAERVTAAVLGAVEAFVGDAPPHDDVSLVVIRRQA